MTSFQHNSSWVVLSLIEQTIKSKIEKIGTPLKDWDVKIYRGILTGYNPAFIIDSETRDNLVKNSPKSEEIIRPILRGRDIRKYRGEFAQFWMITTFPSLKLNIDNYPSIKKHLLSFGKERLEQTGSQQLVNGKKVVSRKKTNHKWFETQDQINYHETFDEPKIIYPGLMRLAKNNRDDFPRFFLDEDEGYRFTNDTYFIVGESLKYLLALLNSKLNRFLFPYYIYSFDSEGFKVFTEYLEQIPFAKISKKDQKPFEDLAIKILLAKRDKNDSAILENKLDQMIFKLYGLTNEEVAYINDKISSQYLD